MSSTESRNKLERIRRAKNGEESTGNGPEIFTCPVKGCSRTVVGDTGALRNHCHQVHDGLRLNDDLEPVERYKIESDLREQYAEIEKSQQEIADEWGVGRNTIYRWLNKHGIVRRDWTGTGASNRVEYATFYTEESSGYERVGAYDPDRGGMVFTTVHQLLAIAQGEDPSKVFSDGEYQTHHRTGIPFDNRPANIELLPREKHQRSHRLNEWTEEDGFPLLLTQRVKSEAEYHRMWGPGVRDSSKKKRGSAYEEGDVWGPGAPKGEA